MEEEKAFVCTVLPLQRVVELAIASVCTGYQPKGRDRPKNVLVASKAFSSGSVVPANG